VRVTRRGGRLKAEKDGRNGPEEHWCEPCTKEALMWVALVGTREAGREGIAQRLETALKDVGLRIGGFRQEALCGSERDRIAGYDLVRVGRAGRVPLARKAVNPELCEWGFAAEAFRRAQRWLTEEADVRFATAGRLEAAERGHWAAIAAAVEQPGILILSVRPNVLTTIALRLPDPEDALELPASEPDVSEFLLRVVALAHGRSAQPHS